MLVDTRREVENEVKTNLMSLAENPAVEAYYYRRARRRCNRVCVYGGRVGVVRDDGFFKGN